MEDSNESTPNTTDMVTRCPNCSTSFRITPEQLQVAKGAVRCGSCLHIFKALDQLITPLPTAGNSDTNDTAPSDDDRLDFDQAALTGKPTGITTC